MLTLDPDEPQLSPQDVAKLCGVSLRTAQRWLSGRTRPPHAALTLIRLTQRQRIVPDAWPQHWRIYSNGALDIGFHSRTVTPSQIEHTHFWLANLSAIKKAAE